MSVSSNPDVILSHDVIQSHDVILSLSKGARSHADAFEMLLQQLRCWSFLFKRWQIT